MYKAMKLDLSTTAVVLCAYDTRASGKHLHDAAHAGVLAANATFMSYG